MPAVRHDDILLRLIKDVEDLRKNMRRVSGSNLPLFDVSSQATVTIAANQNDYDIGNYDFLFVDSDGKYTFSGFTSGIAGRSLSIFNISDYALSLLHQNAGSVAANRIVTPSGDAMSITPDQVARIYYDTNISRWRAELGGGYAFQEICIVEQTSNQVLPTGVSTVLEWDNPPLVDWGEWFDPVNDDFTVNVDGLYQVCLYVSLLDAGGAGTRLDTIGQRVNGVLIFSDRKLVPNDAFTKFFSTTFPIYSLSAGDVITLRMEQTSGGNRTINVARASIAKIA